MAFAQKLRVPGEFRSRRGNLFGQFGGRPHGHGRLPDNQVTGLEVGHEVGDRGVHIGHVGRVAVFRLRRAHTDEVDRSFGGTRDIRGEQQTLRCSVRTFLAG